MEPFRVLRAVAAPLDEANVNTDYIIPARFLKVRRAKGYGRFLFHDRRFDSDGREIDQFLLNRAPYREARILVAGDNFGCGSAREGAVYALADFGIRCVIAPSFGDIFFNSCFVNGILAIRLADDACRALRSGLIERPGAMVTVDLIRQVIGDWGGPELGFETDPMLRRRLLEGLDEVAETLAHAEAIAGFERTLDRDRPWYRPQAPRPATRG